MSTAAASGKGLEDTEKDRPTLLVVEDSPDIRHVLVLLLRRAGYRVHAVADGEAALTQAPAWQPDLAIVDVQLPGMSGLELCRRLSDAWKARLPVILLTANAGERDAMAGMMAGAARYVTKPFSNQRLLGEVQSVLAKVKRYDGSVVT